MFKVEVNIEKCIGCGECIEVCPMEVFELQDELAVAVNQKECIGCESCVDACEQGAITILQATDFQSVA